MPRIASEKPARISHGDLSAARSDEMRAVTIDNSNFGIYRRELALTYSAAFAGEPWFEILSQAKSTEVLEGYLAIKGNIFRAGFDKAGLLLGATVSYPLHLNPKILAYQPDLVDFAAYIADVWVDPAYQRKGFGAALLADAEMQLHAQANTHAMLRTAEVDRNLQSFYVKRGYRIVGKQQVEESCDRVVFVKRLLAEEVTTGSEVAVKQLAKKANATSTGLGGEGG